MSGQDASGSAAASISTGAIPKVLKSSTRKQKHRKAVKNKTAKKNAKILRVTTVMAPEQDADSKQVDDLSVSCDPVENPGSGNDLPDIEGLTLTHNTQVAGDQTPAEEKKIAEQKEQIPDETNPVDVNVPTAEEEKSEATAKIYKVRNRKRSNRRNRKIAKEAAAPVVVLPTRPKKETTNLPISFLRSYSAVVLPLSERKPDDAPAASHNSYSDHTSDEYSGDPYDDYDDYCDYGGVQDHYYEF